MKKVIISIYFILFLRPTAISAGWQNWFDTLFGMHSQEEEYTIITTSTITFNATPTKTTLMEAIQKNDIQAFRYFIENGFYNDETHPTNREKKLALLAIQHNALEIFRYLDHTHPNLIMENPEPFPVENSESIQYTVCRKSHNNLLEWSLQHNKNKTSMRMLLFVMTHCFGCNNGIYAFAGQDAIVLSLLKKAILDYPLETKFFNDISLLPIYVSSDNKEKIRAILYQFGLISTYWSTAPCLYAMIFDAIGVARHGDITEEQTLSIDYQQSIEALKTKFSTIKPNDKKAIEDKELLYNAISFIFFYTFRNSYKKHTTSSIQNIRKDIFDLYTHLLLIFPEKTEKFLKNNFLFKKVIDIVTGNPFGQKISLTTKEYAQQKPFCIKNLYKAPAQEMVVIVCQLEKSN